MEPVGVEHIRFEINYLQCALGSLLSKHCKAAAVMQVLAWERARESVYAQWEWWGEDRKIFFDKIIPKKTKNVDNL